MSDKAAKELGEKVSSPLAAISAQLEQLQVSSDLGYATAAFKRKNERWPTNHAEIKAFVEKSEGLLTLREYDRVDYTQRADGGVDVSAIFQNRTNQFTFTPKTEQPKAEQK